MDSSNKKIHRKCKLNRFEGVTLQLALPSKFNFEFKLSPNSFTFSEDVASQAEKIMGLRIKKKP